MIGGSNAGVRHLFTGQQWYSELGLYDLRNRFYSPDIGRFLQPDPIGFRGDQNNLYRYCRNNPVTRWDPFGLQQNTRVDGNGEVVVRGDEVPLAPDPGDISDTGFLPGILGGFFPTMGSDNPSFHHDYNPFPPPRENHQPSVQHPSRSSVPPQNPPAPVTAPAATSPSSPSTPAAGVFSHFDAITSIIQGANMRLDDDGSGPDHGDKHHSKFTSYYWFYGVNLNADTVAYVVAPQYALSQGVLPGDLAFVVGNGTWAPGIVGDIGSSDRGWGEVSLRMAWNLGVPTVDAGWPTGPVIPQSFGPVPVTIIVIPSHLPRGR
jgi:RHS repeat-associated protein